MLDEALVWAAKSDRVEALPALVELGARIDADPYRGTALDVGRGERSHGVRAPADRARRRPERGGGRSAARITAQA